MSKIIARLGAVLGFESKEFVAGVNAAQQKSKEFKKELRDAKQTVNELQTAAMVTGLAMLAFGAASAKMADQISDLADANDVTVGSVLELKSALISSGGDANKLGQFYSSFTNAIDNAAQGNDKLRDSFKELGITTHDLGFLTNQELQNKALDGLSKIDDVVRRNAIAADMFGKAAKGVDFLSIGKNAGDVAGKFKEQEAAIKAAAASIQKIELLFSNMQTAAVMAMKPITDLFNKIPDESRINGMTKAFQAFGIAMGIAFGVTAVGGVLKLSTALMALKVSNPWLLALGAAGTAMIGAGLFGFDEQAAPAETAPSSEPSSGATSTVAPRRQIEQSSRDLMIAKYKAEKDAVQSLYELKRFEANVDKTNQLAMLELESQRYLLSGNEYNLALLQQELTQKNNEIFNEKIKAQLDAQKQLELASADEQVQAKQLYDIKIKQIDELVKAELAYNKEVNDAKTNNLMAEINRQQSWVAGWDEAFKKYSEAAAKASDRGAQAFESVMSSMSAALSTFVETGKINFASLVGSIIKNLILMELKAQATGLFKMLFSAAASMFAPTPAGTSMAGTGTYFPMAASGGDISSPTIVGENGAELFIPRTPGTVIPNGSWQQMAGGGGNGLTVNGTYIASMSAIDTQSATQFLASNKNTIWAAYQSANRGVPISR